MEPDIIAMDENLNTPPPPSVTLEYSPENLTKPPHPYLEADICLDTESKQILQTPLQATLNSQRSWGKAQPHLLQKVYLGIFQIEINCA